ncbi:MAG TPA: hypothetical protein VIQ74_00655 [Gemmatimonadaceae bacterium]
MTEALAPVRVRLGGLLDGREVEGDALVTLEPGAMVLATERSTVVLAFSSLAGRSVSRGVLELYLEGGSVIRLAAAGAEELAREVERGALALPEFTRSLRTFGSRRATAGGRATDHDRFFASLLSARGEAERAPTLEARCSALDASGLRAATERLLGELAVERFPNDAPERRALEAELLEYAAGLFARFDELAGAQRELVSCDDSERFARWRRWARALHGVFESADECWPTLGAVLVEERHEEEVSRWRRLARRAVNYGGQGSGFRRQELPTTRDQEAGIRDQELPRG